jgi:hypothetical protein
MIGRNTNGGLVMKTRPLTPPPLGRTPDACGLSVGEDDGDEVSVGVGESCGVGVGAPWRLKLAHGLGWTLAQSL